MGRRVSNGYGITADPNCMSLEIVSNGIYAIEILFNTEDYEDMCKYSWCFEQGKGLVYMTDLTGILPARMGYKTLRVYLRDFLLHKHGMFANGKPTHIWARKLEDYRLNSANIRPACGTITK